MISRSFVVPTRVGVNRSRAHDGAALVRGPHARGGEPYGFGRLQHGEHSDERCPGAWLAHYRNASQRKQHKAFPHLVARPKYVVCFVPGPPGIRNLGGLCGNVNAPP